MIAVIDYGMGNLRSVEKGFQSQGVDARVVTTPGAVADAHALVLPGVGAFRDSMDNLRRLGLVEPILRSIEKGKPYLGICLGLQVLMASSEEFGASEGLGVFGGRTVRFPKNELKVPHMGWNTLDVKNPPPILSGITKGAFFYFVHSYYVQPDEDTHVATTTNYGVEFVSMLWRDNVFATQFHPEKSQSEGLAILKKFGEFSLKA